MATLNLVNLGTAADDGTGDNIRAGGQKINDNDTAINAEVEAHTTLTGVPALATDMGAYTGTTITDGQPIKTNIQDLESALETINALSAGYAPLNTTVPAPADTIETAIAKLDGEVRSLNEADRLAGTFDSTVGTFPTTANGGAVNGNTVEAGYWFEVTNAGTIDGVNFAVGDFIRALVDAPSTTTVAGNWVHELNRPTPAYSSTTAGQNLVFEGQYIQGDHAVVLPKITTENDGQAIHIAGVAPWGTPAMANSAWTPAAGDTVEAVTLPAGSLDIVTLVPVFAELEWKPRIGGAPTPEFDLQFDTVAQLPSPTTVQSGKHATVVNDGSDSGIYVATGTLGAAATSWVKAA